MTSFVAQHAPMKRGLKPRRTGPPCSNGVRVAQHAPMKRGLKLLHHDDVLFFAGGVAQHAPMKRGLKLIGDVTPLAALSSRPTCPDEEGIETRGRQVCDPALSRSPNMPR